MRNFKKEYRDLETAVMSELRDLICKSDYYSKHNHTKAIPVNVFDYTELALIDHKLTFIDKWGLHYSLFSDASLEDLIDILNQHTKN